MLMFLNATRILVYCFLTWHTKRGSDRDIIGDILITISKPQQFFEQLWFKNFEAQYQNGNKFWATDLAF